MSGFVRADIASKHLEAKSMKKHLVAVDGVVVVVVVVVVVAVVVVVVVAVVVVVVCLGK